jgi:membrane protein
VPRKGPERGGAKPPVRPVNWRGMYSVFSVNGPGREANMTATKRKSDHQAGERTAKGPTSLPKGSAQAVLKRCGAGFRNKNLTTLAAALTYYGALASVPGLIVMFTVLGLVGRQIANGVAQEVNSVAPGSSGQFVETLLSQARSHATGTGIIAIVGAVIALWSASSYVSSFRQAANIIYEVPEGRPVWKTVPLRLAVTSAAVVLLVLGALIVVVSGSIANAVGNALGVGHTVVVIWEMAKWPVLFVLAVGLIAVLFWASPNAKLAGVRWVTAGGLVASTAWLIVSVLFALYVTNFSSYSKDYGPLAGLVIFLVWLWLTNIALLLGLEVNAELDHQRAVVGGLPQEMRPFVELRDARKLSEAGKGAVAEAQALRQE